MSADDEGDEEERCILFEAGEGIGGFAFQKSREDFRTIQGRDRNQIEKGEYQVYQNGIHYHHSEDFSGMKSGKGEEPQEETGEGGDEEIGGGSREGDPNQVAGGIFEVVRIDGDRFRPADVDDEEHQGADGVEVGEGIEGEPASAFSGIVAQSIGDIAVSVFMNCKRQQDGRRDDSQIQKVEHFFSN